jgi:hypothetical protein
MDRDRVAGRARYFESGTLLGTTRSPRIMLPEGTHSLEWVNEGSDIAKLGAYGSTRARLRALRDPVGGSLDRRQVGWRNSHRNSVDCNRRARGRVPPPGARGENGIDDRQGRNCRAGHCGSEVAMNRRHQRTARNSPRREHDRRSRRTGSHRGSARRGERARPIRRIRCRACGPCRG